VLEVVETARRITGQAIPSVFAPRRAGDPARLTSSASFAQKTLNWKARYSDMDTLVKTSWAAYTAR
jgi:UDP-glucose 4-epimerase